MSNGVSFKNFIFHPQFSLNTYFFGISFRYAGQQMDIHIGYKVFPPSFL